MNIYLLYALLPLIIFPLTGVLLAKVSRKIWSVLTTFMRQIVLLFIGIPIAFMDPDFFNGIISYHREILLSGLFGAVYLFIAFKSCDYIEVIQTRVINVTVRIFTSIFIGVAIIWEAINFKEIIWVIIILLGISLYLKVKNDNTLPKYNLPLGVAISALWGMLFVGSQYYFSIYAKAFEPLTAGYILELWSIPFLIVMLVLTTKKKEILKVFHLSKKSYGLIFLWSAPALIGSYGLAQAYAHLDFILINILFCATLIMAGVFGYLILWEKLTRLQMVIFSFILTGIFIVNYF